MKINFVDLHRQSQELKTQIAAAISRVIENSAFIGGKEVEMFEQEFANYCGVKNCIGVNSGTDAIRATCHVLGIGQGDEVIIPANTFIATALAVSSVGACPVFVDCQEGDFNINVAEIEKKITPRTKAIIPVHLFGQPADMSAICDIAKRKGLLIIEDACQAHGAKFKGTRVGNFGQAAAFSFYPSKNLGAYGDGGAIVTNDDDLANKLRFYREYGQEKKNFFTTQGINSRLDGLQAAILRVKLPHLNKCNQERLEIANWYRQLLADSGDIILPTTQPDRDHIFHLFVIRTNHRDKLKLFLEEKGISCGIHYPIPIHLQPAYQNLGYKVGDFEVSEKIAGQMLSLPMFPGLAKEEVEYIAAQIKDFLSKL